LKRVAEEHHETRLKLLESAGEVFAETGYRLATIRDICNRAGANIAAVNYHFGTKEELYRSVFAYSYMKAMEMFPPPPVGVGPADVRLGEFISRTLHRMLDDGRPAWHGKLMAMEMADPSGLMDEVCDRYMRPHFEMLRDIVRELLGPGASDETVHLVTMATMGQCVFYKSGRPAITRIMPEFMTRPEYRSVIAQHITRSTLAAIRDLKGAAE
jgi:AcrR family transcriptional regulator